MRHIQPKAPDPSSEGPVAETIPERARIAIVCATIVATALVYSTQTASFLHLKIFVLSCGLALLGIATLFVKPGPTTRVGSMVVVCFLVYMCSNILGGRALVRYSQAEQGDLSFVVMAVYLLPAFTGLALGVLSSEFNRLSVSMAIVATATCAAALGIGQYVRAMPFLFPSYPGTSPIYSVFGNSGLLGGYIAIALPLALAMFLQTKPFRPLTLATLAVLATALLLTGSRTAWLAGALGCAVSVWKYPNVRRTATAASVLAAVATLCIVIAPAATVSRAAMSFTASDAGANLRWWFWAGTWEMIKAHPIAGVGLGRYSMESPLYLANVFGRRAAAFTTRCHRTSAQRFPARMGGDRRAGVRAVRVDFPAIGAAGRVGGLAAWFVFALFNSPLHVRPMHSRISGCVHGEASIAGEVPKIDSGTWGGRIIGLLVLVLPVLLWFALVVPSYRFNSGSRIWRRRPRSHSIGCRRFTGIVSAEIDENTRDSRCLTWATTKARDRVRRRSSAATADRSAGLGTAEYLLGNRPIACVRAEGRLPLAVARGRLALVIARLPREKPR